MPSSRRIISNALPLSHFIRRQKVLNLYRDFFRLTNKIDNQQQKSDIQAWVKAEFKSKVHNDDNEFIEMNLTRGREALRELETSLRYAHALKS